MLARKSEQRPRIGLALSGGGARGLAHVGVLRALAERNLPIDSIAGTSAGALVGGTLASGMALSEIESIGRSLRWRDIGRMTMSRMGVQSNERLEQYLRERLPVTRFEELPIPFAAVATDRQSGRGHPEARAMCRSPSAPTCDSRLVYSRDRRTRKTTRGWRSGCQYPIRGGALWSGHCHSG